MMNTEPSASTAEANAAWFARRTWRVLRWIFEYAVPVYVLTFAVCVAFMSVALSDESFSVTLPLVGTFKLESASNPPPQTVPPPAAPLARTDAAKLNTELLLLQGRIGRLEESQKLNLTIISGLAALLTFLGFRGFSTLTEAYTKVSEAEDRAEAVESRLNSFFEKEYKKNTNAGLNIVHGVVAREIAAVEKKITELAGGKWLESDDCMKKIDRGIAYLENALGEANAGALILRARGVKANLLNLKGSFELALEEMRAILRIDNKDPFAWFNTACYQSQICAQMESRKEGPNQVQKRALEATSALEQAVKLRPEFSPAALEEKDLSWLRAKYATEFTSAIDTKKGPA